MEESWEDVSWQEDEPLKEWYVEYIAVVNQEKFHHMTVLFGEDLQDAQRSLLHEVRRMYSTSVESIDITVVKMQQTSGNTDAALFEGMFVP